MNQSPSFRNAVLPKMATALSQQFKSRTPERMPDAEKERLAKIKAEKISKNLGKICYKLLIRQTVLIAMQNAK